MRFVRVAYKVRLLKIAQGLLLLIIRVLSTCRGGVLIPSATTRIEVPRVYRDRSGRMRTNRRARSAKSPKEHTAIRACDPPFRGRVLHPASAAPRVEGRRGFRHAIPRIWVSVSPHKLRHAAGRTVLRRYPHAFRGMAPPSRTECRCHEWGGFACGDLRL